MRTRSTIPLTLSQYVMQSQPENSKGDFTLLMMSLQTAIKVTEKRIRRAGISGQFGATASTNTTGDTQKKLDVVSHDIFVSLLDGSQKVSVMVSEESEQAIISSCAGAYYLAFDPLDGSSNIDANVTIGSIWGIWKLSDDQVKSLDPKLPTDKSILLQSGAKMVSAGYAMYGSATIMTLAFTHGVQVFTLDSSVGEFVLTAENVRIPKKSPIYSVNEGNARFFFPWFSQYLHHIKHEEKKPYSGRYIGSMVGDLHRTLLYGGIYCYPDNTKSKDGKLRLLYEVAPMSFIVEKAGGKASTGRCRALDVTPTSIHQRSPVYLGSSDEVDLCLSFQKTASKL